MSLTSSLAHNLVIPGFPIEKPAPVRGMHNFTVFTVDTSLQRNQRSRKLTARAELAGIKKARKDVSQETPFHVMLNRIPHIEALQLLMCTDEVFTDTSELPENLEDLDSSEYNMINFTEEDMKELQLAYKNARI